MCVNILIKNLARVKFFNIPSDICKIQVESLNRV